MDMYLSKYQCVCLCLCLAIPQNTQFRNMTFEHMVLFENSSYKFDIRHCQIKVKVIFEITTNMLL